MRLTDIDHHFDGTASITSVCEHCGHVCVSDRQTDQQMYCTALPHMECPNCSRLPNKSDPTIYLIMVGRYDPSVWGYRTDPLEATTCAARLSAISNDHCYIQSVERLDDPIEGPWNRTLWYANETEAYVNYDPAATPDAHHYWAESEADAKAQYKAYKDSIVKPVPTTGSVIRHNIWPAGYSVMVLNEDANHLYVHGGKSIRKDAFNENWEILK